MPSGECVKDQQWLPDPRFAQRDGFVQRRDREGIRACGGQRPRANHRAVAVGIALDDGHDLNRVSNQGLDRRQIVGQRGEIDAAEGRVMASFRSALPSWRDQMGLVAGIKGRF